MRTRQTDRRYIGTLAVAIVIIAGAMVVWWVASSSATPALVERPAHNRHVEVPAVGKIERDQ
jgi:hypothetical protein